jgi:hypothetical protein
MSCSQPSAEFLRVWVEYPGITANQKEAMQRQIRVLEDELLPFDPATAYLSPSATPSGSGSPRKRQAERSPTASPSPAKRPTLRGGAGTPEHETPRWRIFDHQHALGRDEKPDDDQLPGELRRAEHGPPVSESVDKSGSANALYKHLHVADEFLRTVFGLGLDYVKNSCLFASYHYGMNHIGGVWKPTKNQAVFGEGTSKNMGRSCP